MHKPHPDRTAETLAQTASLRASAGPGPFEPPGPGSADARIRHKQLLARARVALASRATAAARERFSSVDSEQLLAGTVGDGVARGVAVALEETISLCRPAPVVAEPVPDPFALVSERELKKPREILVASAGSRVRWNRKGGLLFVDRASEIHVENALCFESRDDVGTLDGFSAREGQRARIFSPAFLKPKLVEHGKERDLLLLAGRLGRKPAGFPCEIAIEGRKSEAFLRLRITIDNLHEDHRLRARFVGLPPEWLGAIDDAFAAEIVQHDHGKFIATTLVRACGRLRVGDSTVAVPEAQCPGKIVRSFRLGGTPA